MPPLPTISGSNFPSVELSGNGVEACKAGRLNVSNDRQYVGRKLRRLCLAGDMHALDGPRRGPGEPPIGEIVAIPPISFIPSDPTK